MMGHDCGARWWSDKAGERATPGLEMVGRNGLVRWLGEMVWRDGFVTLTTETMRRGCVGQGVLQDMVWPDGLTSWLVEMDGQNAGLIRLQKRLGRDDWRKFR